MDRPKTKRQIKKEAGEALNLAVARANPRVSNRCYLFENLLQGAFACHSGRWWDYYNRGLSDDARVQVLLDFLGLSSVTELFDDRILNHYASILWSSIKDQCHSTCKTYFFETYNLPFTNYFGKGRCPCCGDPLACLSNQTHRYVELTQDECRKLGVPHFGRCYHVAKCIHCGDLRATDSSD